MNAVAFIFARGGSKGLPDKNILPLAGKPLIAWAIEHAKAVQRIRRVIVSTDSNEIASIAKTYGAEVPFMRPKELAQDDSPEWLAWRHGLSYLIDTEGGLPDVIVSVPTTAPLRFPIDIDNCLEAYLEGGADIVVTVTSAHRNPYFNMVKKNADGTVGLVINASNRIARRQDTPDVYDMTTVAYAANPEFIMTKSSIFEGIVKAVNVPIERSIDIDTPYDFKIAEYIISSRDK